MVFYFPEQNFSKAEKLLLKAKKLLKSPGNFVTLKVVTYNNLACVYKEMN